MTKGDGASLDREEIVRTIEKLKAEHADLKKRVQELYGRPYLSPEEQVEAKTLQKMKLLKKDAIAALEAKLGA
ncbi:MAG: DUF465 domain-containing protein [Deltaproteobacteria bacterium]|nr:DUF465 domain-containing protein [Deltaproteobacteria bacterium]